MHKSRTLSKLQIILYLGLGLVFYNEFLVYWINYVNWPSIHTYQLDKHNASNQPIRLLLVADPQVSKRFFVFNILFLAYE